MEEWSQSP